MNFERLTELKKICEAATPGPWVADHNGGDWIWRLEKGVFEDHICDIRGAGFNLPMDDNAKFIATARTALPELIAECEYASEFVGKLSQHCNDLIEKNKKLTAEVENLNARITKMIANMGPG